jgi:hypothetical protein
MSTASSIYTPTLEALHSLMIAIALSLATWFLAAFLIGLLTGEVWLAASKSFYTYGVIKTIISILAGGLAATFSIGFGYAFLLLIALPQYFLIVLPMLKFLSSDLQSDARRSWMFYSITGFLIGGVPWLALTYAVFGNLEDYKDMLKLIVLPAFLIGAVAGVVMKYRLIKLVDATGIENSIK